MNKIIAILIVLTLLIVGANLLTSNQAQADNKANNNEEKIDMMNHKTATFGGGCFWGVESAFRKVDCV